LDLRLEIVKEVINPEIPHGNFLQQSFSVSLLFLFTRLKFLCNLLLLGILCMCPNHLKQLFIIFFVIGAKATTPSIQSFCILSCAAPHPFCECIIRIGFYFLSLYFSFDVVMCHKLYYSC